MYIYIYICIHTNHHCTNSNRAANVYQERNEHNLITDFQDEIEMYKHQEDILDILKKAHVSKNSIQEDIMSIYRMLSNHGVVDSSELDFLQAYLEDL